MKKVKVLYMTEKAAKSASSRIQELIQVIGSVPGNFLSYTDSTEIIHFLAEYSELLQKSTEEEKDS